MQEQSEDLQKVSSELNDDIVINSVIEQYMPSGLEKKRAVVMYVLFGIIMTIAKQRVTVFEYYHFKQAIGWWISFVLFFVLFAILLFLPVIKFIGLIPLVLLIIARGIFIKQSLDGYYSLNTNSGGPLYLFVGLGSWLVGLFELSLDVCVGQNSINDNILDNTIFDKKT